MSGKMCFEIKKKKSFHRNGYYSQMKSLVEVETLKNFHQKEIFKKKPFKSMIQEGKRSI